LRCAASWDAGILMGRWLPQAPLLATRGSYSVLDAARDERQRGAPGGAGGGTPIQLLRMSAPEWGHVDERGGLQANRGMGWHQLSRWAYLGGATCVGSARAAASPMQ